MSKPLLKNAFGVLKTLMSNLSFATDQQEQTFDRELLTQAERDAYRERLRAAKTVAEYERIHQEHHDLVVARARERGIPLDYPGEPPTLKS